MKKLVSILLVGLCHIGFAQQKGRIAYIDSDFIMSKMPEYEEANRELKKRTAEWEAVIERKKKEIKDLKDQLNVERPLLTQQLIDEKEEDIQIIEKELASPKIENEQEFQQEKFGKDGDYFRQKLNLAKPIQDQISTIVYDIAKRKRYSSVIDKAASSETALLYVNAGDEISDQVLRRLEQTRNKSKLSKKEIEQLEIAERQADIKERQRSKRDELEERQRLLEEEKEQMAQNESTTQNTAPIPAESEADRRKREQLEKIEQVKAERERIRQERLAEAEKRKADILKKQEEAKLAREKAREEALERARNRTSGNSNQTTSTPELSERAKQLREQQAQRKKEAEERKAKALADRKKQIDDRKKKLEEERQQRIKEIEERKKNNK